jgi:hypothetical protein
MLCKRLFLWRNVSVYDAAALGIIALFELFFAQCNGVKKASAKARFAFSAETPKSFKIK